MSKLITNIANKYAHLKPESVERNKAFGVIYNNTTVSGVKLSEHEAGKRVAGQVLRQLGYVDTADVTGSLDDF